MLTMQGCLDYSLISRQTDDLDRLIAFQRWPVLNITTNLLDLAMAKGRQIRVISLFPFVFDMPGFQIEIDRSVSVIGDLRRSGLFRYPTAETSRLRLSRHVSISDFQQNVILD